MDNLKMIRILENKYIKTETKNISKSGEDHISFKEIGKDSEGFKISPPINNLDASSVKSLNGSDEQERFVTMCQETIDRNEFPKNFDQWTIKERFHHLTDNVDKYFPNIPESLRYIVPAIFQHGICGQSMSKKPDWLDSNKFLRGQQFIQRHIFGACYASFISFFQVFLYTDAVKMLTSTQKFDNSPYVGFKIFESIIRRVVTWYMEDPWSEGTLAYRNMKAVRTIHSMNRRKFYNMSYEELDKTSQIPNIHCPTFNIITEDFKDACPSPTDMQCPFEMTRVTGINQGDMSTTQFSFVGLFLLYPEKFGVHNASDEDLEAFCHFWRGLGYLLGIQDRYNFCRGSLQEVRNRSKDYVECWMKPLLRSVSPEWEHMHRCIIEGGNYHLPLGSYEVNLLYLCDIINIKMPRLYESLNLHQKVLYMSVKSMFSYIMKISRIRVIINNILNTFINRMALLKRKETRTLDFDKKFALLRKHSSKLFF